MAFGVVSDGHFICPMMSSILHYCTVSTLHPLSQLVLKTELFLLHFNRELICQKGAFFFS